MIVKLFGVLLNIWLMNSGYLPTFNKTANKLNPHKMTKYRLLRISKMKVAAIKWKGILYLEGKLYIFCENVCIKSSWCERPIVFWVRHKRVFIRMADHVGSQLNRKDVTFAGYQHWSEVFQMKAIFIILLFLSLCCMKGKWVLILSIFRLFAADTTEPTCR